MLTLHPQEPLASVPSESLLRDVHRHMAHPGRGTFVRPISIDNEAPHELFWADHLHDQPYAVYLAHGGWYRTLALDFDARGHDGRQKVESEVQLVKRLLRAADLGFIDCASGPTGGRHLIATFAGDGLSAAHMKLFCQRLKDLLDLSTLDIACMTNPETGCIRPPYSAHRLGGSSQPATSREVTLHTLERGNDPKRLRALLDAMDITRGPRLGVGRVLHDAASDDAKAGKASPASTDGSPLAMSLALRCANQRRSFEEFRPCALEADDPRLRRAVERRRREKRLDEWLRPIYAKAVKRCSERPARPNDGATDAEVVDSWRADLSDTRCLLPDNARRVALVLLDIAARRGSRYIPISVRQIAERANISRSAADRGLRALTVRCMVERAATGAHGSSDAYRLKPYVSWDVRSPGTEDPRTPPKGEVTPVPRLRTATDLAGAWAHPVWTSRSDGGLGESARLVMDLLANGANGDGTVSTAQLACWMGVSSSTVRNHLTRLRQVGLARAFGRGHWAAEFTDPEELAIALGVQHVGARRSVQHAQDRRLDLVRKVEFRVARDAASNIDSELAALTDDAKDDSEQSWYRFLDEPADSDEPVTHDDQTAFESVADGGN